MEEKERLGANDKVKKGERMRGGRKGDTNGGKRRKIRNETGRDNKQKSQEKGDEKR